MLLYRPSEDPYFGYLTDKLLVSCPNGAGVSGGLLVLDFRENSYTKVYDGDCRGVVLHNGLLYVATNFEGLLTFDDNFTLIKQKNTPPMDFHGMHLLNEEYILIVETATNTIGCYDIKSLERVGDIKFNLKNTDENHLNDIWMEENQLYVSMFSPYGGWRDSEDLNKGCIVSVDLTNFNPRSRLEVDPTKCIIIPNLSMPHNIQIHKNQIVFCESMELNVHLGEGVIPFQGFTRGLLFGNDIMYVGQSWMRHLSRVTKSFANCSIEAGIHLYRPSRKVSRFIPLPVNQVYQIINLGGTLTRIIPNRIELGDPRSDIFFVDPDDWHDPEPYRWTSNVRSELTLSRPVNSRHLVIELNSGFPGKGYYCDISVNNVRNRRVNFDHPLQVLIELSFEEINSEDVTVSFEVPFLWSPMDVLGTPDNRKLGIAIKSISFK